MNSIKRNPFQAESMLRATSAYKSAHHHWRGLEGFQICLGFSIKWMISGVSIPLPLPRCYCVFFCIFPSYGLFVPGAVLEPMHSFIQVCSVVLCLQASSLLGPWMRSASRLFPVYTELCSSISYILYSSLRHNFSFNRAPFPWASSLTGLLYVWWQIFVSFATCLNSCASWKRKQRGKNTLLQIFGFFYPSVMVERNLLHIPNIIWATNENPFWCQEEHGWEMQRLGEHPGSAPLGQDLPASLPGHQG